MRVDGTLVRNEETLTAALSILAEADAEEREAAMVGIEFDVLGHEDGDPFHRGLIE